MRRWDEYDVYLFDIDGTLLHCRDAVHYFAFCDTLSAIAGAPMNLDGVVAHGNTDVGILRDALALRGVPDERWRPGLPRILDQLGSHVETHQEQMCADVLEGVTGVLEHLRGRGALLGVATGNLARIGRLKLNRAGLARYFDFGAFSDLCEFRQEVFRAGVAEARCRTHDDAAICAVGDTPYDVRAALHNGIDVIAVATGVYAYEDLAAERPTLCLRALADLPLHSG
jgi:phosphoglycolate phosphatase